MGWKGKSFMIEATVSDGRVGMMGVVGEVR